MKALLTKMLIVSFKGTLVKRDSYVILGQKIGITLQPFFVSNKLGQDLKPKEIKPSLVNKQCFSPFFM